MRLDHPIFRGPLAPKLELGETPTPENYRSYPGGRELPATLPTWKVQEGALPADLDYGIVSTPGGFEDSPDAEWISSGINSKGAESVALGRHGNLFLWGFSGTPAQMTDSARQVFLNALVWMERFDGRPPHVRFGPGVSRHSSRGALLENVAFLEQYGKDPSFAAYLRATLPDGMAAECGEDFARMRAWATARLEYLRSEPREVNDGKRSFQTLGFVVDPVLEDHGVPNRSLELFELVATLTRERGAADESVAALRAAYLPPDAPVDADALQEWVTARRDRLYFSDVYGYRWFVAPEPVPARVRASGG